MKKVSTKWGHKVNKYGSKVLSMRHDIQSGSYLWKATGLMVWKMSLGSYLHSHPVSHRTKACPLPLNLLPPSSLAPCCEHRTRTSIRPCRAGISSHDTRPDTDQIDCRHTLFPNTYDKIMMRNLMKRNLMLLFWVSRSVSKLKTRGWNNSKDSPAFSFSGMVEVLWEREEKKDYSLGIFMIQTHIVNIEIYWHQNLHKTKE